MDAFVGGKVLGSQLGLRWLGKDCIAIVVVDNEEVGVASARWGKEISLVERRFACS